MNPQKNATPSTNCPGEIVEEHIKKLGMPEAELAERMGNPPNLLRQLISCEAPLDQETAAKLEYVLGISARKWLDLETQYQVKQLRIRQQSFLNNLREWLYEFPIQQLQDLGILPHTKNENKLTDALLKFFRVSTLDQWRNLYENQPNDIPVRKKSQKYHSISVWLRLGEEQIEGIDVIEFDKGGLLQNIDHLRKLCFEQPENWMKEIQIFFAMYGLALVYTPNITGSHLLGSARWIREQTLPLIQISRDRIDYHDFWYSLYHQIAHIMYHGKEGVFLERRNGFSIYSVREQEADEFADRMLMSREQRNELFSFYPFSLGNIVDFSEKYQQHPSIVVGEIQKQYKGLYTDKTLSCLMTKVEFA